MSSRQGGKLKPLKAPKKDKKEDEDPEEAAKLREQKKTEAAALKAARDKALKGGPMGGTGGIKKSGKK
ncbi:translation machinery associated TMA7 [Tricholoma matsutake]|nr:translation machinery associated TMA7 [Tricholoma matsutake 945]